MWANRRSIFQGAKVCIKIELFKKNGFGGVKFNKIFAFFVKMRAVSIKKEDEQEPACVVLLLFVLFMRWLASPLMACALAADYGCSVYFATFFPPTI